MKRSLKNVVNECDGGDASAGVGDGGASAPDAGGISSGGENSPISPSGGCDHQHNGFFGSGCFHAPLGIWGVAYGGSRRRKTKKNKTKKHSYEKGIKIIKSYDDLVSESQVDEPFTFVLNVPSQHLESMLASSQNENERFNIQQFTKYLDDNKLLADENAEIVGIFGQKSKQCFACAVLTFDQLNANDCYICELMTLRRGFGMILLNKIIDHTENTWLMSDIDSGEDLCKKFYRKNGRLTEIKINGGHVFDDGNPNRKTLHLFYADNAQNPSTLKSSIIQHFTENMSN